MNAPIRRLSFVVAILFASLLVSTTMIQFVFAADLNAPPITRILAEFENPRFRAAGAPATPTAPPVKK